MAGRRENMKSREALTALRMDSVPPLVMAPQTVRQGPARPPPRKEAVIATTSASICRADGNTSGCSGLVRAMAS